MKQVKSVLHRAARGVLAVIHDKQVQRSARQLAALAAVRGLLAVGASAEVADLVRKALGA